MRVFLAGATGAIGRPLVRMLVEAGHDVVGTTRSPEKARSLRAAGAEPVVLDALDEAALRIAIADAAPEVVIHQLTALSEPLNPRRYQSWLAETNRLRADVTPVLVDAARKAGARRVIAQSISFMVAPGEPPVADETAPLNAAVGAPVEAVRTLEETVTGAEGIDGVVLRYGFFYGPGTSYASDGQIARDVRRRRFPIVGSGEGRYSFIHVDDAAAATMCAIDRGCTGIYNVVDDEPARQRDWLPVYAQAVDAKPPRHVPAWLARLVAGPMVSYYTTQLRGNSNAKAKRELGWTPRFASWREGFGVALG